MKMSLRSTASAIFVVLIAVGLAYADEVPVLTVCDVLSDRAAYNGKSILLVGKYGFWEEGVVLEGECPSKLVTGGYEWPNSIWLGYDAQPVIAPPSNPPEYRQYETRVLEKLPVLEGTELHVVAGCSYSGVWAAVYGRFETKDAFPVNRQTGVQRGFGHLSGFPAQLVWPEKGFWCLVPADKLPALAELDTLRRENGKLALWRNIKAELQRSGGLGYFEAHMRGRLLPSMKGTVTSTNSSARPSLITVAISDSTTPEATLRFDPPLTEGLLLGAEIDFEGVAVACILDPFMMTLNVDASNLIVRPKRSQP
jgi:hypothetical protein